MYIPVSLKQLLGEKTLNDKNRGQSNGRSPKICTIGLTQELSIAALNSNH